MLGMISNNNERSFECSKSPLDLKQRIGDPKMKYKQKKCRGTEIMLEIEKIL